MFKKKKRVSESFDAGKANMETPDYEIKINGQVPIDYATAINDRQKRVDKIEKDFEKKDKLTDEFIDDNHDRFEERDKMKLKESTETKLYKRADKIANDIEEIINDISKINWEDFMTQGDFDTLNKAIEALQGFSTAYSYVMNSEDVFESAEADKIRKEYQNLAAKLEAEGKDLAKEKLEGPLHDLAMKYVNATIGIKESKEAVKGSKIKITGGSCDTKWTYDTMTTPMSMYFVINNIPCEFKFSPNHGRYVVNGVDCNHIKFEGDSYYKDLTRSGGTARSYALNIPGNVLTSQPNQKQKDFSFTGQYYSTTPAIRYCKELLKELLTQHPDYFHDDILDKLGLAQSLEEAHFGIKESKEEVCPECGKNPCECECEELNECNDKETLEEAGRVTPELKKPRASVKKEDKLYSRDDVWARVYDELSSEVENEGPSGEVYKQVKIPRGKRFVGPYTGPGDDDLTVYATSKDDLKWAKKIADHFGLEIIMKEDKNKYTNKYYPYYAILKNVSDAKVTDEEMKDYIEED